MKKRFFMSVCMLCIAACTMAQSMYEDDLSVVYYMPLTQLAITVEYDETTIQPGPFNLYAERYLGEHAVVTETQKRFAITSVRMEPHTVADTQRSIKVDADAVAPYLTLTPQGLLYGYNVGPFTSTAADPIIVSQPAEQVNTLMPLMEEQLVASSTAKMAEGAAKQIYHIRETRINILAGDVEHLPADGKSMQLVLDELDKREAALSALFIGTTTVQHHSHTYYITPDKDINKQIIGRFSQFAGIVKSDNLSGEPLRLSIKGERHTLLPMQIEETSKKKAPQPSPIYYNLPGSASVCLEYGNEIVIQTSYPIAQYGVAVPLSKSLWTTKSTPKIYFNTQTGNILSIEP